MRPVRPTNGSRPYLSSALFCASVVVVATQAARAQYANPVTGHSSTYDFMIGQWNDIRMQDRIAAAQANALEAQGRSRIAGGRASNSFAVSSAFNIAADLKSRYAGARISPLLRQMIGSDVPSAKAAYLDSMRAEGLRSGNLSDVAIWGYARSFALLGQRPVRAAHLRAVKANLDEQLLRAALVQGLSDLQRQRMCEEFGVRVMFAERLARMPEREAQATARDLAKRNLSDMLGINVTEQSINAFSKGADSPWIMVPGGAEATDGGGRGHRPGAEVPSSTISGGVDPGYAYRPDLDTTSNATLVDNGIIDRAQARGYLNHFYANLAARGGSRNNIAEVLTLIVAMNYSVQSDVRLTDRQWRGTVLLATQMLNGVVPSSQSDGQIQLRLESLAISAEHNFVRYQALKTPGSVLYVGQGIETNASLKQLRRLATAELDAIVAPMRFAEFRLGPDGFTR